MPLLGGLHAALPAAIRADRHQLRTLLRWTALGLLLRLLLMPFTLSYDRVALDMFPVLLSEKSVWDVYSHLRDFYSASIAEQGWFYYSPLTYFTLGAWHPVVRILTPGFDQWMASARDLFAAGGAHMQHYAQAAGDAPLLRAIWLLKLPLLAADLGIGLLILHLAGGPPGALRAFKLWMLNPATLYATYIYGQFEIVDAFFLMAALLAARRSRPHVALLLLGIGASFKTLPLLVLLPQGALLLASDWRGRLRLFLLGLLPYALLTVPLVVSSNGYLLVGLLDQPGRVGPQSASRLGLVLTPLFVLAFGLLLLDALLRRRSAAAGAAVLARHWTLTLVLLFGALFIEFHHFTWLSPLLVLLAGQIPLLVPLYLAQVLALVPWTFSPGWNWWSLLAPLGPDFFPALPTPEALLSHLFPWGYLARAGWYLWVILSLAIALILARDLFPPAWPTRLSGLFPRRPLSLWRKLESPLPSWERARLRARRPVLFLGAALLTLATALGLIAALPSLQPGEFGDIHQVLTPRQLTPPLASGTVEQSFVPSFDGLTTVEVFLAIEPGRQPAQVDFEVRDSRDRLLVNRQAMSDTLLPGYHRFSFDPIVKSSGRLFPLRLSATAGPGSDVVRAGIAHGPYSHTATGGRLFVAGTPRGEDLAFQTFHASQKDWATALQGVRRRLVADPLFLTFYGTLLLLALAGLLSTLPRRPPRAGEPGPRPQPGSIIPLLDKEELGDWAVTDSPPSRPAAQPLVSIVVVHYRGHGLLDPCLASVFAQAYRPFEVVLVDNGCEDGSIEEASALFPSVRLVRSPFNLGFAGGANLGAAQAAGELVVFLNDDAVVDPDWLDELVRAVAPDDVALARSLVLDQGWPQEYYRANGSLSVLGYPIPNVLQDPTCEFYATGCSMIYKRALVPDAPFDPDYFAYYEDTLLGWRMRLRGYRVVQAPRSVVHHRGSVTSRQMPDLAAYYFERNRFLTPLLCYQTSTLLKLLPLHLFDGVLRLLEAIWLVLRQPRTHLRGLFKHHVSVLRTRWWVIRHLPLVLDKRRRIQHDRRVGDDEILSLFSYKICDDFHASALVAFANRVSHAYLRLAGIQTADGTEGTV